MHRRSLLAGVGGLLSLSTAGCLGNLSDDDTEITDVAFETGIDVDKRFDDDPSVTFEDDEIHATGKYSIGNACYDESLEEPSYDPERDELKIQLTRTHDGGQECTEIEQLISYRVVVYLDGGLPGTVTVTEDMGGETTEESGFVPW